MNNLFRITAVIAVIFCTVHAQKTYDGLTFVFGGKKACLYDMDKTVVHEWTLPYDVAACADLLRDSSILVPSALETVSTSMELRMIPLPGGRLQIINWNGDVTWEYTYAGTDYIPHHDIEPVYRTNDPTEKPTILLVVATAEWGDKIVEIRPKGTNDADIIWEWVASDHRCNSGCDDKIGVIDPTKRTRGGFNDGADIMHTNNVSFNPLLNQIIVNMKGFYEFIVLDHSTTTVEARGSTGGKYGKGGEILYRWGNPDTYGASDDSAFFKGQHGSSWIPLVMPGTTDSIQGGGNFVAVDNGNKRVVEIMCPGNKNGIYPRENGKPFAPEDALWSFSPEHLQDNEGSIQKLPNGNYLICSGGVEMGGSWGTAKTTFGGGDWFKDDDTYVYEVNSNKEVIWELTDIGKSTEAVRYAYSYLGGSGTPIQTEKSVTIVRPADIAADFTAGKLTVTVNGPVSSARLSVHSLDGRVLMKPVPANRKTGWTVPCRLPAGMYLLRVVTGKEVQWKRVAVHQ